MTLRAQDVARLVALALIWSASFVFIRVLVPLLGPLWVAAGRLLIAGVALAAWLAVVHVRSQVRMHWRGYALVGLVNCALPFVLFAYAAVRLPASYLVIVNALTPLFAAALSAALLRSPLGGARMGGLLAGVVGVALVTRAVPVAADGAFAVAVGAGVGAALCYAVAAVWLRHRGAALAPLATATWSQLFGGVMLLPFALPTTSAATVTGHAAANLLALALLCSGVAYILFFRLIRDIGATRALTVTFIMPAFGMIWGAWLLDESVTPGMIAGAALILAGTAVVLRSPATARAGRRIAA
jgi:drug/metabolite transporter (DMT)-like permease